MTTNQDPKRSDPEMSDDARAPWAVGFAKASELMGISLQAILPAVGGVWLDAKCGTYVLFFFIGLALGMTCAALSLMRFVSRN